MALVNRPGADHRVDEVLGEFFLEVIDVNLGGAGFDGFLFKAIEFFFLADVGAEADHLRVVFILDPGHEDRGVETARVS